VVNDVTLTRFLSDLIWFFTINFHPPYPTPSLANFWDVRCSWPSSKL
jgi:hypothetical protein